ncbi:MAG: peptidase C25, partial [Thermoplasmatales archaeon]|nr:peptidase C25 [Thermoplasmatales archaeon]
NEYLTINLEESESLLLETGKPVIPVITKVFTFPLGTKIVDVNVDFDIEKQVLSKKIQPSPKPIPLTDNLPIEKISTELVMDEEVYSSSALYPAESYTVRKGAGLNNGEHVLFLNVKITPQYSPADDILYVPMGEIDIGVEYVLPETPFFTGLETYDMLIITPDKFSAKLQPLVDHKNSIGVSTILDTTENIYSTYNGRDDPEDIKLRIKDAIEELDIQYVLLAGGRVEQTFDWHVPSRRTNNDDGWESGYESDLYYADVYKIVENETVFEDWDSNGNYKFAEDGSWIKDKMDFYPDVTVGRIPFRSESEIDIVVNKIIEYENNADDSWFKKAVMIAGDTFTPGRHGVDYGYYEGEMETAITVDLLEGIGFDVEKLWLSIP